MTTEEVPATGNEVIQKEEMEALLETFPGQVWVPTDCHLHLRPQDSCFLDGDPLKKHDYHVVLHIKCSAEYPDRKPHIELLEPHGLSQENLKTLLELLRKKADENEGLIMIGTLASAVMDFLTDLSPRPTGSFHDDMLANNAKTEAEKNRKRQDTEQKELDLLEEEMLNRSALELQKTIDGIRPEGETKIIGGRRIIVLSNIPVTRPKPHSSCHEWMGFYDNTQLLISEWSFRYNVGQNVDDSKSRDFGPFLEKLDSTYMDINALCEISNVDLVLVNYAFVELQKIRISSKSMFVQLYVAQKVFSYEENMNDAYQLIGPRPNLLRTLAAQALFALRYLHDSSLSHTHLSIGSVWMSDSNANGGFRFSDFGSMGPLLNLAKIFTEICSEKYIPDGETQSRNHKDKRRQDCFQLGTLLDTLVMMSRNLTCSGARSEGQGQRSDQSLLSQFIAACQEAKNTDQLMNHPFLGEELVSEVHEELFAPFGDHMNKLGRLRSDFVVLRTLGKGGFGDVVLARNKMDATDYAVKRVPLNTANGKIDKKSIKEAKFIASLNHPNMVRYFNAWEEECVPRDDSSDDEDLCAVPVPGKEKELKKKKLKTGKSEEEEDALGGGDSILPMHLQKLVTAPQSKGAEAKEWSATYFGNLESSKCGRSRHRKRSTPSGGRLDTFSEDLSEEEEDEELKSDEINWDESDEDEESEDSEDSDEDEGDESSKVSMGTTDSVFDRSLPSKSAEDDDIVFVADSSNVKQTKEESVEPVEASRSKRVAPPEVRKPRILCIQMEYCDRGTLRQYIDDNQLEKNPNEAWRIFAEILCGIQYMHEKRIYHRDIKPLNIFLTSQNGVKIGDFGLATVAALRPKRKKAPSGADKSNSLEAMRSPPNYRNSKEVQQTRDVGTQLYMAPELFHEGQSNNSDEYDEKIDIYSAGVVLFEMFYRPLPSGMDRVSTLNALRDKLKIPADFGCHLSPQMAALLKKTVAKMMAINPDERPSAAELLNDEDLPMHTKEDATFRNLCEKVVKKRDCRMNAWLLDKQFKQDVPTAVNYCYDVDLCQDRLKYNMRESLVETLRAEFCNVLKVHAFEKLHTHTLMPVSTALAAASVRTKPAEFLDKNGIPVALPMDLRQNFVRFCVRNSIQRLKRYNFGRVYSQNQPNLHPHEKWECCVDCIGPQSSSPSLEAELLLVACEMIATSLPKMKLTLKIGHSLLLEAQIRYLKLSDDVRLELLDVLHILSVHDRPHSHKEKVDLLAPKVGMKTANIIAKLLIPVETNFNAFKEKVANFRKKLQDTADKLAAKAIRDLEDIITTFKYCRTEELEKINIVYDAQTCYRPRTFGDGLVFQIQVEKPNNTNKHRRHQTVLAGGRYDSALLRERHPRDFVYEVPLCISGFGINMDMVAMIRDITNKIPSTVTEKTSEQCKVLICSKEQPGGRNLVQEKFRLAKKLWALNIQADVFHNPVNDIESLNEHRIRASITHIVALTNANLEALVKTDSGLNKMSFEEVVSTLCRETQSLGLQNVHQTPNSSNPLVSTPGENSHEDHGTPVIASRPSRSASASHISGGLRASSATAANLNVIFACSSERYHRFIKEKKRVENQVTTHLGDFVTQYSAKTKIEVIVVDVPVDVIKRIVGEISKTCTFAELDSFFDNLAQQFRVDLSQLKKQLHSTLHGSSNGFGAGQVVILYRNIDNFYRCLT